MATTNDLISKLMNKAYNKSILKHENSLRHKKLVEKQDNIQSDSISSSYSSITQHSVLHNSTIQNTDDINHQSSEELIVDISNNINKKINFDEILLRAFFG